MNKLIVVFIVIYCFSTQSLAGAVSAGGGSVGNHKPMTPVEVASAYHRYVSPIILMYLINQEYQFEQLTGSQLTSPFFKLFRPMNGITIFEILRSTQIEIRMNGPCFDKNGVPKDGSMYASKPNAVCISPYSMASKLNNVNVYSETIGIVLHELSHLAGTTEDEAIAIQNGILELNHKQMIDARDNLSAVVQGFNRDLSRWADGPRGLSFEELNKWLNALTTLQNEGISSAYSTLFAVRYNKYKYFHSQRMKIEIVRDYLASREKQEDAAIRIWKGFGNDKRVSVGEYHRRNYPNEAINYEEVFVTQMDSLIDAARNIEEVVGYFEEIRKEMTAVSGFHLPYYEL